MEIVKNIKKNEVIDFTKEVTYLENQIVSKTIVQDKQKSITIFSFDKGQEISTHKSSGDAIIQVIDGEALITVDGVEHILKKGMSIVMENGLPHSVYAKEKFKMILMVVFKYE